MEDKQVFFQQPDGQTDSVNTIDLFCVRCRKLNLGPSVSPFQRAHQYHRQCHDYRRSQHGRHVTCVICHLPCDTFIAGTSEEDILRYFYR